MSSFKIYWHVQLVLVVAMFCADHANVIGLLNLARGQALQADKDASSLGKLEAVLEKENLVAWCIVPFDAQRRTPEQRAQMLVELGIKRCAYDWRDEHVVTFEEEIKQYQRHGIEFFAFWAQHDSAFDLFEKYDLHPQIWQIIGDPGGDEATKVQRAAERLVPLAERTRRMGCKLALYNHMGWDGQPENMVAVCRWLRDRGFDHVGIVYNFHHGHEHIAGFEAAVVQMMPYLLCVNINGMNDRAEPKILGLGKGKHEATMLRILLDSGYQGPIGIIDHRPELDAKQALQENLDGLESLKKTLFPKLSRIEPVENGEINPDFVSRLQFDVRARGDAQRGAAVFGSDQNACVSCHQISLNNDSLLGGSVGPDLQKVLAKRSFEEIVESLWLPNKVIEEPFRMFQILTVDGTVYSGFKLRENESAVVLQEISTGKTLEVQREQIDQINSGFSPMPAALMSQMSHQQRVDLLAFLLDLKQNAAVTPTQFEAAKLAHQHGPASFPYKKEPLAPQNWPNHSAFVNRDRVYDFYTKQAEFFRGKPAPLLLAPFPGLDGGQQGHWGNQNEKTWEDGSWNQTQLGSLQSGVFRDAAQVVTRGICVQLPDQNALCFDPDTLSYRSAWKGGFLSFSSFRHGFIDGIQPKGEKLILSESLKSGRTGRYRGLYRYGAEIFFAYDIDGKLFLDSVHVVAGQLERVQLAADEHPMWPKLVQGGPSQWPQRLSTKIVPGTQTPFAIDTIELPTENPWSCLLFPGGHDFLPDGSALLCTIQGDVWRVSGLEPGSKQAEWKRFASGLHHPLDLWIDQDGIFVQCRDQLVRLHDLNGDMEADYYECFCNLFETSPAGHDYICGLQRDSDGNFYTATGNQGLIRISKDGMRADWIASGFRNPDGLGILPDNTVTVPCSEGEWTPASMICAVRNANSIEVAGFSELESHASSADGGQLRKIAKQAAHQRPRLHYGYRGPVNGQPPELPLVYLPRGMDNSSGGQAVVPYGHWAALQGQLLHLSFGAGAWFSILIDQVDGQLQGGVVPIAGDFLSSVHRGRFCKSDGNFYVSGMQGWGAYTVEKGCFQRVRFTGDRFQHPTSFHTHRNGVVVQFAQALDTPLATDLVSHFAQAWNYRYSGAYGSSEFSPAHPGVAGHDPWPITRVVQVDHRTLFLEIPDIQPVSQLHLRMHVNHSDSMLSTSPSGTGHDLIITVHKLDGDFTGFSQYHPVDKSIAAHPLLADLAKANKTHNNPWLKPLDDQEYQLNIAAGKNLTYQQSELTVSAGTSVALTFHNPDVVPHNWVLVKPNKLTEVGELANLMISNPEGYAKHYVPDSELILVYTDIVNPGSQQTIHFRAPLEPGRYPYLCTFPGHWAVMNGILIIK